MDHTFKILNFGKIVEASSKVLGNISPHIKVDNVVRVLPVEKLKDYAWDIYILESKGVPFWRIADILGISESYARKLFKSAIPIWK